MTKPIVAVVGRPNVGKSTFVNRIAQSFDAIVHESSGVTRDRSYHEADWNGVEFVLIDTGGIEVGSDDEFQDSISSQAKLACQEADAIIFLVDGRTGATDEDLHVARLMQKVEKPVYLAVNKLDNVADESGLWDYYSLGLGDPYPISALHGHGTGDLLDEIVEHLPEIESVPVNEDIINVAIIGRPNAGKSSLTNKLTGVNRSIVSDVAGTTRDAIDTTVMHDEKEYRIIDTAGLRRKSLIDDDIEYYGFVRAMRAIDRADVALLVVDATLGITDADKKSASLAHERGCAMVILLNKWDLLETPEERDEVIDGIEDSFGFVSYAPVIRISALTGRSIHRIWDAIDLLAENRARRIPTSRLNEFLARINETGHTVVKGVKRLKINYVTQTGTRPPTFTFFANTPSLVDNNYERFMENRLREEFELTGTPIRLKFKNKQQNRGV